MRMSIPQSVRTTTRTKPKVPVARVCEHPECDTVLSRYNSDPYCWRHQDPVTTENL